MKRAGRGGREDRHQELIEMLPWLVNGTLSDPERALVEQHVHECLPCYAMLQQERRMRSLIRGRSTAQLSAEQGFERLMARIDRAGHDAAPVGGARRRAPRSLRSGALAVAAGVVVFAAAVLIWAGLARGPGLEPAAFETLTSAPAAEAEELDIVFAESLSEVEMRAVLREIDATIVAGPTQIGRYTVRLERALTDAELAALVDRLERDGRVRFAGRSFIREGR